MNYPQTGSPDFSFQLSLAREVFAFLHRAEFRLFPQRPATSPAKRTKMNPIGSGQESSVNSEQSSVIGGQFSANAAAARLITASLRQSSAGFQPAVSPTSSRQTVDDTRRSGISRGWRIGNPRHSRLEVCATIARHTDHCSLITPSRLCSALALNPIAQDAKPATPAPRPLNNNSVLEESKVAL